MEEMLNALQENAEHTCDPVERMAREYGEFINKTHQQELKALLETHGMKLPEDPSTINDYLESKGYMLVADHEDDVYTFTLGKIEDSRKYKITAKFDMEGSK